ncbi:MAG TPA: gluconokinase, partial [Cyclobacteriaceae bacterium]|nr:gluconokinase [Cyclobacteriaceae bacterium]
MKKYVLAVDIGTTSVKALAVLPDGQTLNSFQVPYPTHYPHPGFAEQDPNEIYQAFLKAIQHVLLETKEGAPLALSFSSALHSLVAIDKNENPITPLIIWADTRSSTQAAALKNRALGKHIYELTGTPIHPMSPLSKLLWMKEKQPDVFSSALKFISIKEFVIARLTGEYVVDYSVASATGLFDSHTLTWSKDVLDLLDLDPGKLSKPVSPFYTIQNLSSEGVSQLKTQVPIVMGGGDGCLANLGSGAMHPGDVSITIGTSGAVRMTSSEFKYDDKSRIFNYRLDENTFVVGGATNNGAMLLSWFTENFEKKKTDSSAFIEDAFSVNSERLIFLPYVLGERSPMYDPEARGVFFGVSISHTRSHFKRALLEGICFELKSILDALEETVSPALNIIASGGFIQSAQWVQLLCDILGKPITIDSQNDASSMGAAIQGFQAMGIKTDFKL